jgi:hypothetical protein
MIKPFWQFAAAAVAVLVSIAPGSTIKGAPHTQNASAPAETARLASSTAPPASLTARPASVRDGQHDFDFVIGTWKSHVRRLQKPLTGSTSWIEGDATVSVRKIWNGRGNLEEIELTTPAGHLEGLTLRLYDPQAHQWRLYWANASQGVLTSPVSMGEFKDGRGEFYDQETLDGKIILVRHKFWNVTPKSYHFEQAFSADRGQTWEANWIADVTRTNDEPITASLSAEDRNRDFDFNIGHWDVELKRLTNPLSGNSQWTDWKGTGEIAPVWNGRGSVAEFEFDGPTGHLQGVGLRLYNSDAKQWTISWANGRDGVMGVPIVGEFKDGHGDFFDIEEFNGRQIFVRNNFSKITPDSCYFEQAFSGDNGRTWEPNWLMTFRRRK